jgi:hypothetical protein
MTLAGHARICLATSLLSCLAQAVALARGAPAPALPLWEWAGCTVVSLVVNFVIYRCVTDFTPMAKATGQEPLGDTLFEVAGCGLLAWSPVLLAVAGALGLGGWTLILAASMAGMHAANLYGFWRKQ